MEKLLYTTAEVCDLLGIGRTTLYELINANKIQIVRIGRRGIRVSKSELERYVKDNQTQG